MTVEIDPFAAQTIENPFPFFVALRRDAPVYELPNGAYWLVSRYEDCRRSQSPNRTGARQRSP